MIIVETFMYIHADVSIMSRLQYLSGVYAILTIKLVLTVKSTSVIGISS